MHRSGTSLLLVLLLLGCGKGYDLVPVQGRVTRGGQPVADLHVTFQPVGDGASSPGPASTGVTDADGVYELRCTDGDHLGAVAGEHVVTIVHASLAFFASDDDAAPRPTAPFEIPQRFSNGETRINVAADGNGNADFALDP